MSQRTAEGVAGVGTDRIRWAAWMVAAFVFAGLALTAVMLVYSVVREVVPVHITLGFDAAYVLASSALLAGVLLLAVRYAKQRMGAPDAVWFAMCAFAVVEWALGAASAHGGFYAPLRAPVVMTIGIALAWVFDRRAAE